MIRSIADLIAFLKRFHRHWLDDPSLDPGLIPVDLPPGLAAVYRELGALIAIEEGPANRWRAPFAGQDVLLPVGRLDRDDGMVTFARENSGNWSARCPVGVADPPVYSDAADVWNEDRRGFVEVCGSLDHFLITLCLQEALMGCRHLAAIDADRPPERSLTVPLRPLWLDGWYVAGEPDHHFYVSADRDTLVMDWAGLWVGSPIREVAGLVPPGGRVQVIH